MTDPHDRTRPQDYAQRLRGVAAEIRAHPERGAFGFDERTAEHFERHASQLEQASRPQRPPRAGREGDSR